MNTETIKKLKCFINKPVTVFTENIGRNYTDTQYGDYFTGICTNIGADIVEIVHPITKCVSIFFIKNIIAICEEQQLDPNNPDHQKIISEINSQKEIKEEIKEQDLPLSNSVNIDIDLLNKLIDR